MSKKKDEKKLLDFVETEDLEGVKKLIGQGVNINTQDVDGNTPILIASASGNIPIVNALINANADINKPNNDKMTPLYIASHLGDDSVVELLLSRGADANKPKEDGTSPLIIASANGHEEIVKMLLTHGAKVNHSDNYGYRAAVVTKNKTIFNLLKNYKGQNAVVMTDAMLDELNMGHALDAESKQYMYDYMGDTARGKRKTMNKKRKVNRKKRKSKRRKM
jgi:ankyrin repeat protein